MKITFCTTCMNYLEYLKEVYPSNLKVGKKYDCDFVLVNYSSTDGMDAWVKKTLKKEIKSGLVSYHYIQGIERWNYSAGKNASHRLGEGDVLINLDADNYLTKEYIDWVIDQFTQNPNIVTEGRGHGMGGRVAVWKEDYDAVGGYDESLDQPGTPIDHAEFVMRVMNERGRDVVDTPSSLCPFIPQESYEQHNR